MSHDDVSSSYLHHILANMDLPDIAEIMLLKNGDRVTLKLFCSIGGVHEYSGDVLESRIFLDGQSTVDVIV